MSGQEPMDRAGPGHQKRPGPVSRAALGLIGGYQRAVSPGLGKNCRYLPTCSAYMYKAIEIHGFARGAWMGLKRIGRCHPLREGGYDPVPGASTGLRPEDADAELSRREDR